MDQTDELAGLLERHARGDEDALSRIFTLVYDELKRLARLRRLGSRNQTLNTTGLVHEVYLKLASGAGVLGEDRAHFLNLAARAMRQVLVDHARKRMRDKRGGGVRPVTFEPERFGVEREAETLLTLDRALDRLGRENPRRARVFECRYFAGLSTAETAEAVGASVRTVERDWQSARHWLRQEVR